GQLFNCRTWIRLTSFPFQSTVSVSGTFYKNPNSNLAASDIMSCEKGGSKVSSTSTLLIPSIFSMLDLTSEGMDSAAGQLGDVKVINTNTLLTGYTLISYISPNSETSTGISGSYSYLIAATTFSFKSGIFKTSSLFVTSDMALYLKFSLIG